MHARTGGPGGAAGSLESNEEPTVRHVFMTRVAIVVTIVLLVAVGLFALAQS